MRFFVFIFGLYILCLAMLPCTDADTCKDEKTSFSSKTAHQSHDHGEDDEDTCTPFCICACCGSTGFVLEAPVFSMKCLPTLTMPFLSSWCPEFIPSYFYSFWQPPKLS